MSCECETCRLRDIIRGLQRENDELRRRLGEKIEAHGGDPAAGGGPSPYLTAAEVLREVAREYQIPEAWILLDRRDAPAVRARQVSVYLLRRLLALSTPQIGRILHRDHGSVLNALSRITAKIEYDPKLKTSVARLTTRLMPPQE